VYGVTPFQLLARQRSTSRRMSLISEFCSRRSPVTSKSSDCCSLLPFLLGGIGMKDSLGRRPGRTVPVGPSRPSSKWASGGSYGEFRIGLLMSAVAMPAVLILREDGTDSTATTRGSLRLRLGEVPEPADVRLANAVNAAADGTRAAHAGTA